MDGGDDLLGWMADGVAAGLLGAAVGTALLLLGLPMPGVVAAAATALVTLTLLRQVKPEPRRFKLPKFALAPLEAEPEVLELVEVAAPEPLELVDRLDPLPEDTRVVQLFGPRPLPTPGELRQRIEAHLEARPARSDRAVLELEVDAAAALRDALGDLRRSLA